MGLDQQFVVCLQVPGPAVLGMELRANTRDEQKAPCVHEDKDACLRVQCSSILADIASDFFI